MSGLFSLSIPALRQTPFPYLWVPLSHFLWLSPFLAPVQSHFRSLHSKGPKLAKVTGDLFAVKTFSPPRPQMLDMFLLPSFPDLTLSLWLRLLQHWLPGPVRDSPPKPSPREELCRTGCLKAPPSSSSKHTRMHMRAQAPPLTSAHRRLQHLLSQYPKCSPGAQYMRQCPVISSRGRRILN